MIKPIFQSRASSVCRWRLTLPLTILYHENLQGTRESLINWRNRQARRLELTSDQLPRTYRALLFRYFWLQPYAALEIPIRCFSLFCSIIVNLSPIFFFFFHLFLFRIKMCTCVVGHDSLPARTLLASMREKEEHELSLWINEGIIWIINTLFYFFFFQN